MVRTITKYVAEDNVEFATQQEAEKYELLLAEIAHCRSLINEQPDPNSPEGIQNTLDQIVAFDTAFRRILERYLPSLVKSWDANPYGWIGRVLSDGSGPIWDAIDRLYSVGILRRGADWKYYGQPYYANQTRVAR